MFIPDPDLDILHIPDSGVKKAPDPESGSATLPKHTKSMYFCSSEKKKCCIAGPLSLGLITGPKMRTVQVQLAFAHLRSSWRAFQYRR
jgi:hypothetical protein